MSRERAFIDRLVGFARDPAARGLADDAAVLPFGARDLVLTHDMLVEGIHYLPTDPPADVAWKLLAVNLSDLAAKGARPIGVLMGYMLGRDAVWDAAFADGLAAALAAFDVPLLGGDTVRGQSGQALGLTALGETPHGAAPARSGAEPGDGLWMTGTIGAAGLGLAIARAGGDGGGHADAEALAAYRRPRARLAEGRALGGIVHAMADISDGLLIDVARMAEASGRAVTIALERVPYASGVADDHAARLAAVTAGDDYELLFAASPAFRLPPGVVATRIGAFSDGRGLLLSDAGQPIALPSRLGYQHD